LSIKVKYADDQMAVRKADRPPSTAAELRVKPISPLASMTIQMASANIAA